MGNGTGKGFAVPVISFCDIPLSKVSVHVGKYGGYAIGVSKEFATTNQFSKVLYLDQFSSVTKGIFGIHDYTITNFHKIDEDKGFSILNDGVLQLLQVMKNNVGPLIRKAGPVGQYKFFEEMEWRYTPFVYPKHNQVYADFEELEKHYPEKPHLPDYSLPLKFDDINWIIVRRNDEIPSLISSLKTFANLFQSQDELEILISRILSIEQIENDF